MDTLKIAKENVKMIAHRGLSGLEKENTIAAFIAAGNRTYYGTECDIHLTKDNVFVVCHDESSLFACILVFIDLNFQHLK